MVCRHPLISRLAKYAVLLVIILLFIFFVAYWSEDSKEHDTGFIPSYEHQAELSELIEKAETHGLSKLEKERLEWLLRDEKRSSDAQLDDFLERQDKEL